MTGPEVALDGVSFDVIVRTQGRRPGSLREAMVSLGAQTFSDFAVIVVVHGSSAIAAAVEASLRETGDLPERWSVHTVSGGNRARPLNAGLDRAGGDYVTFLDDDDLADPDWLVAFARGAADAPGQVIRAVTKTQDWTTLGTDEPRAPTGEITRHFAPSFDLLAHFSHNETPICSIALPRAALQRLGLRFDETLPVLEDWDLLMRSALGVGVHSVPEATSLYRLLDTANAKAAVDEPGWCQAYDRVLGKLSAAPVELPGAVVGRLAAAHFAPGGPPLAVAMGERRCPVSDRACFCGGPPGAALVSEPLLSLRLRTRRRIGRLFRAPIGRILRNR